MFTTMVTLPRKYHLGNVCISELFIETCSLHWSHLSRKYNFGLGNIWLKKLCVKQNMSWITTSCLHYKTDIEFDPCPFSLSMVVSLSLSLHVNQHVCFQYLNLSFILTLGKQVPQGLVVPNRYDKALWYLHFILSIESKKAGTTRPSGT